MVINQLILKGMTLIEGKEYSNPRLESILVLSHLLDVDKSYIYINGHKEVDKHIENAYFDIMSKRAKGHPLQYLLNSEEFMGLNFYLEEGVLIPRPDTELLVEFIMDRIDRNKSIKLLDIGIGSGAISLSIAKKCPNTHIIGIDLESMPIKVSNINKERLNIDNAHFYQGDLFEALEKNSIDDKFDFIVSNPPYIRTGDIENLQVEVKDHEPLTALDGGDDGLEFYRRISKGAKDYLMSNGMLIYEVGCEQGDQVMGILNNEGFKDVSILKDYQGLDRVVYGFNK